MDVAIRMLRVARTAELGETNMLDPKTSLREIALARPSARAVLSRHHFDYCCGADQSLAQACNTALLDPKEVVAEIEAAASAPPVKTPKYSDWTKAPLAELIGHLLDKHHVFTRQALGRLREPMRRTIAAHRAAHPDLERVAALVEALEVELTPHLMKEEQMLFPYVIAMERASDARSPVTFPMFGSLREPTRIMMLDHDNVGQILHQLREATGGYRTPADACPTWRDLYEQLSVLDSDLVEHIHLENEILFPRAVALEQQLRQSLRAA
jgi:regulator of cell morphogenesis and NO signaling